MAVRYFIFFILGVLLLVVGYIFQQAQAGLSPWAIALYGLGVVSVAFYIYCNRRDLALMLSRRSARYGAVSILFIVSFLGILVMVGLFSQKHHYRWDLTKNKTHSIALQSRQLMERLNADTLDLYVYAFYSGESERPSKQPLIDLLDAYSNISKHLKYELVDLNRNPLLALQLGISSASTVFLKYGQRQEKIYSEQEAKITNAVAKLLGGGAPGIRGAVYFVTGHGEPELTTGDPYNYGQAKEAIEDQIGPVRELVLATGKEVPDSCEILVVGGPEKDFLPLELEAVGRYLARGGKALFLLEPFTSENLIPFLARYGIQVGDDIILDLLKGAVGSPFAFLADSYDKEHEITRYFDVGTVFDIVRSVRAESTPPSGITVNEIVRTSEKAHAETDRKLLQSDFEQVMRKASESGSSVPFAVAASIDQQALKALEGDTSGTSAGQTDSLGQKAEARLVVIGDKDFISDGYLGQLGNRDFLLNCLRWLQGQSDEITIAPKETENTPLVLERSDLLTMGLVTVLVLPASVVLLGLFVWVRRRAKR